MDTSSYAYEVRFELTDARIICIILYGICILRVVSKVCSRILIHTS